MNLRLWPRPGLVATGALRLAQSVAFLRGAERRLSRFQPTSELSRLNRSAGTARCVSPLLFRLVATALAAARVTDGRFDPTVLPALLAAGYTRTFAQHGEALVGDTALAVLPGRYREVRLDRVHSTVLLPRGGGLDLGGIAKGWLADVVLRRLRPLGAAAVDIGGDCAFTPSGVGDPPWLIEVADPWTSGASVADLAIEGGGGVATSGILRRRWQTSRGWQHHLIDPRTGVPATTDLASVTVVAPSATTAEVLAKLVLFEGRDHGSALLARDPRVGGLLIPLVGSPIAIRLPSLSTTAAVECVA
ncbi:MAG: FAD:protein FMN transferase [Dehalococcoidia bacterium]